MTPSKLSFFKMHEEIDKFSAVDIDVSLGFSQIYRLLYSIDLSSLSGWPAWVNVVKWILCRYEYCISNITILFKSWWDSDNLKQCSLQENFALSKCLFQCAWNCATTHKRSVLSGAICSISNFECCKCARMRFHCANGLVVLRGCAPYREHQRRSQGGCWRGSSNPLSDQNIDGYFLVFHQHCTEVEIRCIAKCSLAVPQA